MGKSGTTRSLTSSFSRRTIATNFSTAHVLFRASDRMAGKKDRVALNAVFILENARRVEIRSGSLRTAGLQVQMIDMPVALEVDRAPLDSR